MNPSAIGWIPKFLSLVEKQNNNHFAKDEFSFYKKLKAVGFIFGISLETLPNKPLSKLSFTTAEYTKINLFHSLLFTFFINKPQANYKQAIQTILEFYKELDKGKRSFFHLISISKSPSQQIEEILSSRLHEGSKISTKVENKILPNSLLFIDVLAFRKYLATKNNCKVYEQELESTIINFCYLALQAKHNKNNFDEQLIEQLEDSTAYLTFKDKQSNFLNIESLYTSTTLDTLERWYVYDLCCLAVWDDKQLDKTELDFLRKLKETLDIPNRSVEDTMYFLEEFSSKHSTTLSLFEHTNPLNQLYKNASDTVKLLILRNKNRLIKEINESGELMVLLGNSTLRELTVSEKDKVKSQLLDICKTIPSLTIFLIPGGSLLLPLLVKYIPSLLPSAFNENKIQTPKKNKE